MSAGVPIALPDADVRLVEWFLAPDEADALLDALLEGVDWEQHPVWIGGRRIASPRLSAWYGDPGASYRYSGETYAPKPWIPPLARLRERLEAFTGGRFNSALANLYRDGRDSMGWHADDEPELGDAPLIASLSLGATRRFRMRHRQRRELDPAAIALAHGSLLLMRGPTQRGWQHAVPKTRRVDEPRVNLTYRWVDPAMAR